MKASLGAHFNIPSLSLNGWLVSISACICPIARWEGSSANSLNEGRIEKTLGDGAYDRKELFNELEKRGILSGIKMRKDAATKSRRSPYRSECVRRRNKVGYKKWAEETGYGMRWKVEGLYSGVKRIFGETVRATSKKGMIQEAWRKFY